MKYSKYKCRVCGKPMRNSIPEGWICPECYKDYRRYYDRRRKKKIAGEKSSPVKTESHGRKTREDAELEEKAKYYNTVVCPDIVLAQALAKGIQLFKLHRSLSRNAGCRMNKNLMREEK